MKKLFTILFLSAFFFLSFPQSDKIILSQIQPGGIINFTAMGNQSSASDAMGYYCYIDQNGKKQIKSSPENLLTSIFPGYPIAISGTSFEGGILCNMDSDNDLEIVYNIGYTIQAWNYNGTVVPGWPKNVSYPLVGAPAYGDIDGDGQPEIVVGYSLGSSGFVGAFKKDGSVVPGFPVNNGYIIRSPVLADVDGDGFDEIVVTKTTYPTGQLYIYKGDGTVLSGWPQPIDDIPGSSSAVGDINNDGSPEIIAEGYSSIYAWTSGGTLLPGFPYAIPNGDKTSYSSPVLADVDNDNMREIIFGTHNTGNGIGRLYILKNDGTVYPNFPKLTNNWIYGPPAVGYIDGDNILDIAVGDQVLSGSPVDKLYAWNVNGQALAGFPVGPLWAINDQVVIADIDDDTEPELVFDDNAFGEYHAYHNDGTPVSGWPLITDGITFFNTPALADVNGDGTLDMLGAGITDIATNPFTHVYLWNLEVPYDPARITIPVFQYNTKHNGLFVDPSTIPVELVSFTAECNGDGVLLKWETATELNNKGFEIQRSVQNEGFYTVGFVNGHGTAAGHQYYSYTDRNLDNGTYSYRLKQVDYDGSYKYSDAAEVEIKALSSYMLEQNWPNPFNPTTIIRYGIKEKSNVKITVLNAIGEEAAVLLNEEKEPGVYQIEFNAASVAGGLPSGVYFYRILAGSFTDTKKMLLLK
jgi:hypothetical protein